MMSKKWAFSLTILITIFAFAFAVTPAMAANRIKLSIVDADPDSSELGGSDGTTGIIGTFQKGRGDNQADISAKSGIQVIAGEAITIRLTAAEVMDASSIQPTDFVLVGSATGSPETNGVHITQAQIPATNGKEIDITLLPTAGTAAANGGNGEKLEIYLQPNSIVSAVTGRNDNTAASLMFEYVHDDGTKPVTLEITRSDGAIHPLFEDTVTFTIKLSEEPKTGTFTKSMLEVKQAKITSLHYLGTMNDDKAADGSAIGNPGFDNGVATGVTDKLYLYALVLTPDYKKTDAVSIKVKKWKDQYDNEAAAEKTETFQVAATALKPDLSVGTEVGISNDVIIPANGYLIVAKNDDVGTGSQELTSDSLIKWPGDPKAAADRLPFRNAVYQSYNMIEAGLPDLENFLINGGTIDLKSAHAVKITEIMWGTDGGSQNRQWIEIHNTTDAALKTKDYKLVFYAATEAVPPMTAAVAATATTAAVPAGLPAGVADRVGTIYKGAHWSIAGIGQSGRIDPVIERAAETGQTAGGAQGGVVLDIEFVGANSLVSMQRGPADAMGMYPDGTMKGAWTASTPPSGNFEAAAKGLLVGTPGFAPIISDAAAKAAADAAAAKAKADAAKTAAAADTSVIMPKVGQIYISEVMFAEGGTLPQWIEISNGSRTEQVNLSGWTLTVDNAAADADVAVGSITFTIPEGTRIDPSGQDDTPSTILVVTETGRTNIDDGPGTMGADQILNLWETQQTELILGGITKRRYSLLSGMAFQITLAPPVPIVVPTAATPAPTTAAEIAAARAAAAAKKAAATKEALERAEATDMVGNLGADGAAAWALPMNMEGGRSSIIRTHVDVNVGPAEPNDGTMMDGWVLASDTAFVDPTHIRVSSYYGAANDVGTPGFRAGSALPVELSSFRPTRDKATGQVVITWSTQSELNNAGFFIKRSQQRTGEFKIINATMIAGAGTTSEKQFYTYTDTTAQPNVVYYYQIEDVSLDGNRQTLTRGIRLKGHVGAAGKATTLWGELKMSHE